MRTKFFGTIIIALMISLASCAPTRNTTTVVRREPKVIVVNKPRPNKKVIVVNTHRNRYGNNRGRGGRVIVIR